MSNEDGDIFLHVIEGWENDIEIGPEELIEKLESL